MTTNYDMVWKDIPGWEGYYQASRCGQIRSLDRQIICSNGTVRNRKSQIMVPQPNKSGHMYVRLSANGSAKSFTVHALVATTWIGPRPKGLEVCHGDRGVADNSVVNIRYDTRSANVLDCRKTGRSQFSPVRRSDGMEFFCIAVAAEETGCSPSGISNVCSGRLNICGGYGWNYI